MTELAPNLIEASDIERGKDEKLRIGVLFGGENKHFTFGDDLVRSLSAGIKKACDETGGIFNVTTSRRTSAGSENILSKELKNDPRCESFVVGKNDQDEDTVKKIMQKSRVILVSGESISMVSEAVSSSRPVLVFIPDKKTKTKTKYEKFVERLGSAGVLRVIEVKDIPREISNIAEGRVVFNIPDDRKKIYEKLYKLF
ncbi:MAG: ELM1/GtrOC1 family putative glycosyltransferase [Candidatus Omnitrophota bacterium]